MRILRIVSPLLLVATTVGSVLGGCGSDGQTSAFSGAAHGSSFSDGGAAGDNAPGDNGGNGAFGGGSGGGSAADASTCVNLQCKQVACANGAHTTVSGVVYDPAGKNPLYNVVVYVPNAKPQPFATGASCDKCDALYTGSPLVTTLTDADGRFTLKDVPVGQNIPLVIQIGKWRRQITIPAVQQCTDNALSDRSLTRLPASRAEGDIPSIAISTGGADSMECLLRRIGVDASEYAKSSGRIQIFKGSGGKQYAAGSSSSQSSLWSDKSSLMKYDMVILSCEGGENGSTKPAASLQALQDYANAGGRVFASHFHYYWFEHGPAPFPSTATWTAGSNDIGDIDAQIDTSFPKGQAFATWMQNVHALEPTGLLHVLEARHNADVDPNVNKGSRPWIAKPGDGTQYFTFNAPVGAPDDQQCGRVVYSDLHVGAASNDYSNGFNTVPEGCTNADLSDQEKALEFMLFDLSSCVTPDTQPPAPPPPSVPPPR